MCIELYEHNKKTFENIEKMWEETNRVAAIQPTGTGKSFLILKCAEKFNGENIIILTPQDQIIKQFKKHDKGINGIQYLTYAKLQFMTDEEIKKLDAKLIVLDEFHRCGAEKWGSGVQRLIDTFTTSKVLGTSATPIRFLDNARDMSDELFEANIACNMTLPEAIIEEILPMPRYVSALYTFDEEADNMIDKVNKSKNSDKEKAELISGINKLRNKLDKSKGVPKILKKHITNPNGRYLVFCKTKEHMEEMKGVVTDWFYKYFKLCKLNNTINTYEVYSDYDDCDGQIEAFTKDNSDNAVKLLFCINMLNEGLHISNIDGVILLRPTDSPTMYYQQIGRAIDAGSKEARLILDLVNNFASIRTNTLKEDLEKTASEYCDENGIEGEERKRFIDKFKVIDESCDVLNLFNEINDRLYDNWELYMKGLEQFVIREGHSKVPINHVEIFNGRTINLGSALGLVRREYNRTKGKHFCRLDEDRIKQLKSLDFDFSLRNAFNDKTFEFCYSILKKYYIENGNCNVPALNVYDGIKLGAWVQSLRISNKNNKLSNKEILLLKEIDFNFNVFDCKWMENYYLLCEYKEKYKTTLLKKGEIFKGVKLDIWTNHQREYYKKGKLSQEKINKLKEINFVFENITDYQWNLNYNELKKYYTINGNSDVPYRFETNGIKLGLWVFVQRKNYKNNKLDDVKINRLKELMFRFLIDKNESFRIKIICLENNKVFNAIKIACNIYNIDDSIMSSHLKGKAISAGKHPETGEPLHWMYYDEYVKLYGEVKEQQSA